MDTRRAKQLIYGTFYGLVWLGVFAGVYFSFARPVASCFNGVKDDNEEGVDCGGVCAKVCLPADLARISVLGDVLSFASGQGHYTFLGQIANKNSGFAARSFDYHFDLYDESGTLIQSFPGRSFIYGGEVKYLVAANEPVPDAAPATAELVITNVDWTDAASLGVVPQFGNPLVVTGSAVGSSTVTVSGRITDGDVASFSNILIVAVLYDANGNPIGASETVLDGIAPNQTEDFSVTYPPVPNANLTATKFYAYALRP